MMQLQIARKTLTDGSYVFNVQLIDIINGHKIEFECVDLDAARQFVDHMAVSVDAYTVNSLQLA